MNTDTKTIGTIRQYVESAYLSLQEAKVLLEEISGNGPQGDMLKAARQSGAILAGQDGSKIIEGVFDGQNMVGPDGKQYSVPANYASKSKLVEGDRLKLTIAPNGSFIYKQIGPVERRRLKGKLTKDEETGEFRVLAEERSYKVLTASITYFKGQPQDDVVVLIPRDKPAAWATVENIIHADTASVRTSSSGEAGDEGTSSPLLMPERELPSPGELPALTLTAAPPPSQERATPDLIPPPAPAAPAREATVHFDDEKDEFEEI